MGVELIIEDKLADVVAYNSPQTEAEGILKKFFEFWPTPREFSNPDALRDCGFFDLYISHYVRGWPSPAASPPHPGIFEDFFPTIISRLVGPENTLTLCVQSSDSDYFDELKVIRDILAPQKFPYVLLPILGTSKAISSPGYLFFEWPLSLLEFVVEQWFMCPQIRIEGFISAKPSLGVIAELFFKTDSEARILNLLKKIEIGFKVWPDFNGSFLLSDKVSIEILDSKLQTLDLNRKLEEASRNYL